MGFNKRGKHTSFDYNDPKGPGRKKKINSKKKSPKKKRTEKPKIQAYRVPNELKDRFIKESENKDSRKKAIKDLIYELLKFINTESDHNDLSEILLNSESGSEKLKALKKRFSPSKKNKILSAATLDLLVDSGIKNHAVFYLNRVDRWNFK